VSSRAAEKERRKIERREHERLEDERRRRARIVRATAAVAAVALALAAVVVVRTRGGDPVPPFGAHERGAAERAAAARVPPSSEGPGAPHVHPNLYVFARGRRIVVPAGIGVDTTGRVAALHTHGDDGTIHAEGMPGATLGQLFEVWGVTLTRRQLGPFRANPGEHVGVWVDGIPTRGLSTLRLRDRENVAVSLGGRRPPIG
jgi:hypothetical protein